MEPMKRTYAGFRAELHLSPLLITGMLTALATAVFVVSDGAADTRARLPLYLFCIAAYGAAALTGLLAMARTWLSQAASLTLLMLVVYGGAYGLQMPAMLVLAGAPTISAAALIGMPAAALTAIAEAAVLAVLGRMSSPATAVVPLIESGALLVHLVGLGVKLGLIYAVYHRTFDLGEWLWGRFEQAQRMLEDSRDKKAVLQQAMEDLVHANRQLALANERTAMLRTVAEEARKSKTSFVAKVSHEFRTPLNMIIGLVSLMIESPQMYAVELSPDMRRDLQIVYRNCQHLTKMVNDVLNLTQVESGRLVLHRERFALPEIVMPAVNAVLPLLEKKRLTLEEELPETLPTVYCDRTRVQQVVLNLVSNAARFTEEGGIRIRARQSDQMVVVEVQDTGPGILLEDQARIFEPFCQGTTELWRDTGGSGLGLTISKQFIEAHGGRIWFESERGIGTTFFFSLPISSPVGPVARAGRWINEDWSWHERASYASFPDEHYRPRVLVYDTTGDLYAEFARRQDAVDFVSAGSTVEIIEALKLCPAHAVIVNEPDPDTQRALMQAICTAAPTTPVFGSAVPPMSTQVVAPGATGYLTKPITSQRLVDVVEAQARPVSRILVIDDDADVLSLFERMLLAYDATLEIATAAGGQAGLNEIAARPPDMVLLDLYMPNVDGQQVLTMLRGEARTADLPVYIVSAHDPTEHPPGSPYLVTTMGEQFSVSKLLDCLLALSEALLAPDGALDPALPQAPEAQQACSENEQRRESALRSLL